MFQVTATSDVIRNSLLGVWNQVAFFLPQLIAAIIVFLVGWLIAAILGKIAYHLVVVLKVNKALEALGFKAVERGGVRLDAPLFFGELVKWFFIIVFLLAAVNIVGLTQVADFLGIVVLYIPNVIVAAVIVLIGVLVARFLENVVRVSIKAAKLASANFLATLTRWAVLIFAFLIALDQLKVASDIIRIFIIGVVAMIAIGGGLAFGLGGQRHAEDWLATVKKKIQD